MIDAPLLYGKKTASRWRERLAELQSGECCICRRKPPINRRTFDVMWAAIFAGGQDIPESSLSILWVDHSHQTGVVRGLLCADCNAAIMPYEFGGKVDRARRRYLAEGDRLQRAMEHLKHRVVKSDLHSLRLVTASSL